MKSCVYLLSWCIKALFFKICLFRNNFTTGDKILLIFFILLTGPVINIFRKKAVQSSKQIFQ